MAIEEIRQDLKDHDGDKSDEKVQQIEMSAAASDSSISMPPEGYKLYRRRFAGIVGFVGLFLAHIQSAALSLMLPLA